MKHNLTLFFKVLGIIAFFILMLVFFMGGPGRFVQDPHSAIFRERFISHSFDHLTGEHIAVKDSIMKVIHAPESYNHIATNRYDAYLDTLKITTLYIAKDSSGKRKEFCSEATVSIDGKITKLTISPK